MSKIVEVFCKIIPRLIPANVYLLFVNLLALRGIPADVRRENYINNRKAWRRIYEKKWSTMDFSKSNNVTQQSEEIITKDSSEEVEEKKERFIKAWKVYLSFIEEKERAEENKWRKEKKAKQGFEEITEGYYEADKNYSEDTRKSFEEAILIINETLMENKDKFYIERQSELKDLVYGIQNDRLSQKYISGRKLTASDNACEVIAVYNASLDILGFYGLSSLDEFLTYLNIFEGKGIVKSGYFGTSGNAIYKYLKNICGKSSKKGSGVEKLTGRRISKNNLNRFEKEYKSYIMMSYNDASDLNEMVHTICISKTKDGYKAHNDYEGSRESKTLYDAVFGYNEYKSKPIMLIGLKEYEEISN